MQTILLLYFIIYVSIKGAEELADFEKTEVFLNMGSDQKIIARVQMRDKIARRQRNDRDAMTSQLDAEEQILLAAVMEKEIELQKTELKQGTVLSYANSLVNIISSTVH